ncbi:MULTISPECIES: hypothetical protein [Streptomyces]|uniref:hypothetical protein n=1 Tax=Streptomyces TaxID=1883 RepID=UPI00131B7C06|nr:MULTISPECIES: hypothetical protein [Streptomyces]
MSAIVTTEMASLTDEELRLSFELMHGVPCQRDRSERGPMQLPDDDLASARDAATDHGVEEPPTQATTRNLQAMDSGDVSPE